MTAKTKKTTVINRWAFTLIEMLIVIAIIAMLLSIMIPCLSSAKKHCQAVVCRSNICQLYIANIGYTISNDDYCVLAGSDLVFHDDGSPSNGGCHRWHGTRQSDGASADASKNTSDATKGPLSLYLAGGEVKQCPANVKYYTDGIEAFEAGCGGYGYNSVGVGSRCYQYNFFSDIRAMKSSMKITEIENPSEKVMFADTAYVSGGRLIEYSFCEPPMFVLDLGSGIREYPGVVPSIHFRHLGKTNVVWCDGNVSAEKLDLPQEAKRKTEELRIGWFGPDDNALFRPWD
jgi:prepilin-type N-terminal cleavage/methylation domain-containing protein/prepilin-type processing-associated H-X9-DG protein